ncbi:ABC transporter permease [uncultured Sphaerochaeta sp.]|uniref:ABC transporter permease n=1 Tax=uncultured Sphaerochaeta sp. TaxID=886478 RepID=UPI002A0A204B|nr:ABC transporter permease [uncultured Sphaerochaeta sp.]
MKSNSLIRGYFSNINFAIGFYMVMTVVVLMILGFFYLPYDPNAIDIAHKLQGATTAHILGTDQLGRDIYSRVLVGTRVSLLIGILVVGFGFLMGTPLGALSGYFGGKTDEVIMKLIDTQMAFPGILLALMIIAVFGTSLQNTVLALGLMSIPRFTRIARSGFMKYRNAEFVQASRARGASHARILVLHILPNIVPELLVTASLGFASAVMSEAGLSYLGLGMQPPNPSFGKMLSEAQNYILQAWWYVLIPSVAISLLVMGFNLLGDGLQTISQQ